jgi:methionyl-tRNA synthetase
MEQLYSEAAGKFLADRFVSGTCPKCSYADARGDQCDNCGALMNPTELIDPKCKITGTTPVVRSTRHVFLDLPKLADKLQAYIDAASRDGGWSANCLQVTSAWMRDGLKQRCITRDLKWGIPVPLEGFQ